MVLKLVFDNASIRVMIFGAVRRVSRRESKWVSHSTPVVVETSVLTRDRSRILFHKLELYRNIELNNFCNAFNISNEDSTDPHRFHHTFNAFAWLGLPTDCVIDLSAQTRDQRPESSHSGRYNLE